MVRQPLFENIYVFLVDITFAKFNIAIKIFYSAATAKPHAVLFNHIVNVIVQKFVKVCCGIKLYFDLAAKLFEFF